MKRVWFIVLPFLLIFASCPGTTPFDALEAAEILTETDRSFSGWNVSYDITTTFDFLGFFDAGGVSYTTTGLADASCPVYRLELVNLMTDGGFEAGTITWTPYGSPIADEIIPGVSPYDIAGDVFHYDFGTPNDNIDFDLDSLLLEFSAEGNYVLRFDLKSYSSNVAFEQRLRGSEVETWSLTISNTLPGSDTLYHIPEEFTEYVDSSFIKHATENFFTIGQTLGDSPIQEGYIDNLRVARTNTGAAIVLEVLFSDATGSRPDLLSGCYRFSVKVLNDPEVSPHANGLNRMAGTSVTLGVEPLQDDLSTVSYYQAWEPETSSAWDEWTTVYLETGKLQIDAPEDPSEAVLSLSIVPTNPLAGSNEYDAGSFLIAEPSLEYSSDGTFD